VKSTDSRSISLRPLTSRSVSLCSAAVTPLMSRSLPVFFSSMIGVTSLRVHPFDLAEQIETESAV
jgi:hypothetical protein